MRKHLIATLINFCSNEQRFLPLCVEQAKVFSSQVIVAISDHFFNGEVESFQKLKQTFSSLSGVEVVVYPFLPDLFPPGKAEPHLWHSLSRLVGYSLVLPEIEYVLFLDADEIAEGKAFLKWLDTHEHQNYAALKLYNYWYFREEIFQAHIWEMSPIFIKKSALKPSYVLDKEERGGTFKKIIGEKKEGILGLDQKPLIHHYSWVRPKEEMLKKVKTWGHRKDRDWEKLVEKEFSSPFQGTDFVHGYSFEQVKPIFDFSTSSSPHPFSFKKISSRQLVKLLPGFFWKKLKYQIIPPQKPLFPDR